MVIRCTHYEQFVNVPIQTSPLQDPKNKNELQKTKQLNNFFIIRVDHKCCILVFLGKQKFTGLAGGRCVVSVSCIDAYGSQMVQMKQLH